MTARGWSSADVPSQDGRTIVVTGATSGIGRATAQVLAAAGARVVLACRDVERGRAAAADMTGRTEVRALDLADLGSVRAFADDLPGPVDVLVNNAGVVPTRLGRTADGFELAIGTNHLGHFALTGLLLDRVTDRVVSLSSLGHRAGRIDVDDLNWEHRRWRWLPAYAQSKLATLMFAFALERRFAASGSPLRSVAAHPGLASTNLVGRTGSLLDRAAHLLSRWTTQSATEGALPVLFAATAPDLPGGAYLGPAGPGEMSGPPRFVGATAAARDTAAQDTLWSLSERLTTVHYPLSPPAGVPHPGSPPPAGSAESTQSQPPHRPS